MNLTENDRAKGFMDFLQNLLEKKKKFLILVICGMPKLIFHKIPLKPVQGGVGGAYTALQNTMPLYEQLKTY